MEFFMLLLTLWEAVCICQVRIKQKSQQTKEKIGGIISRVHARENTPQNSITQNALYPHHWPILCHCGTRWFSPEQEPHFPSPPENSQKLIPHSPLIN